MKTILFAFLWDTIFGDPPNAYHPVAWMGNWIGKMKKWGLASSWVQGSSANQLSFGLLMVAGGSLMVWGLGRLLHQLLAYLPPPVAYLLEAWLLKTMFSLSGLTHAAEEVSAALQQGQLAEARRLVSWHLVSRDTSMLDASQLSAATIESVAENLSDGVIAPLLYYRLFGLSGAILYRYVNTCDAMLGYRDEVHEWLGKGAARFDDFLNIIPARLTAVLMLIIGGGMGMAAHGLEKATITWRKGWKIWRRDAWRTDSPNAGHPMSATAGVLDISLEKVGQYNLGAGSRRPNVSDIGRAVRLVQLTTMLAILVFGMLRWRKNQP